MKVHFVLSQVFLGIGPRGRSLEAVLVTVKRLIRLSSRDCMSTHKKTAFFTPSAAPFATNPSFGSNVPD